MPRKLAVFAVSLMAGICILIANPAVAQDKLPGNPFADKMFSALFNKKIHRELELVDEQQQLLEQILSSVQDRQKQLGSRLKEFSIGARPHEIEAMRSDLVKEFDLVKQDAEKSLFNILLPHQRQRLGEVTARLALREAAKQNSLGVLAPEMIKWLEIDEEQAERLRSKGKELKAHIAREIERLNKQAIEELMKELTPKQREKYEKLIGAPLGK